jgi:beta-lactamase regulating signal transducer with metallopeptidase domain
MSMQHLFWALFNALWQSAAVALAVGIVLRFIPRTTAAQRYAMWFAVLVAAALLPVADLLVPSHTIAVTVRAPRAPVIAAALADVQSPAVSSARESMLPAFAAASTKPSLPLVPFAWFAITCVLLIRLGFAYVALRKVKSSLVPDLDLTAYVHGLGAPTSRRVVVGTSPQVAEPCAIGFIRPAIALSSEMAAGLQPGDLERVLRHEYAHVRRYDDYANLVQRLLATVFFFNPVVHLAGRAMAIEREIACDDAAAAVQDDRVAFARCLYEIARTAPRRRHAAASGFIGSRRQIAVRVARLVERNHNASTRLSSVAKIAAITVLAISIGLAGVHLTALAVPESAIKPQIVVDKIKPQIVVDKIKPQIVVDKIKPQIVVDKIKPQIVVDKVKPQIVVEKKVETRVVATRVAYATAPPAPPAPTARPAADADVPGRAPEREHEHRNSARPSRGLIDALADAGFKNLSVDDLVSLANRGVSPALVDELHQHGLTPMPASSLERFADSVVTGAYIAGLAQLGYPNLAPEDYIRLRDNGVTLEFVRRLQSSGLIKGHATVEQLIRLSNAGV